MRRTVQLLLCLLLQGLLHVYAKEDSKTVTSLRGNTETTVSLRSHSFYAPYVDTDLQNRWFDFGGNAVINTNKHIRLTQDKPSQQGFLWSRVGIAPNAFEIEVEFKIDGRGGNIFGDGFAFWLTSERAQLGPVFGSSDYWHGLGIFFDTFANTRHSYTFPRIYGILNDGTKSYDLGRDGQGQEIGACSLPIRRAEIASKFRVTYYKNKFLELAVQYDNWDEWTTCFSVPDVELPANPYLGLTASTGDVSDTHDIIAISSSNIVYHPGNATPNNTPPRRTGAGIASFVMRVLKYMVIVCLIAGAVVAYRGYQRAQAAKRF